jgi:putative FmdB family regulatory protein
MPIYNYVCADCGAEQEHRLLQFDSPTPHCNSCGAPSLSRQVTAPSAFVFNGGGTYDKGHVSKKAPQ